MKGPVIFVVLMLMNVKTQMSMPNVGFPMDAGFSFSDLLTIIKFSKKMYSHIQRGIENDDIIREIVNGGVDTLTEVIDGDQQSLENIQDKLHDISSQLNHMVMRMEAKFSVIEQAVGQIPLTLELDTAKRDMAQTIKNVKKCYDNAVKYSEKMLEHNPRELRHLTDVLTGMRDGDLRSSLETLHSMIISDGVTHKLRKNFLTLFVNYVNTKRLHLCGEGQSPNQYLFDLYTVIVTTEMMGLVSLSFGYQLQRKLDNVNITFELREEQSNREKRLTEYFMKFKKIMEHTPLSFRACDPPKHTRGETFIEMEGLYQALIIQEYGKNKEDSCQGDCNVVNLKSYENKGITCGRLYDCQTIYNPTYCELDRQHRRYEWIQDGNDEIYGEKSECHGVIENQQRYFYWLVYSCDLCICTCEGNSVTATAKVKNSTHVISLLPSVSDFRNNRVITGVRFAVKNGIVHIQVKEGKLQPAGEISSENWKTVPDTALQLDRARREKSWDYTHGKDFIIIDEYHNAINLDDVIVPPGHIVTGVKFALASKKETLYGWQRLELQVQHAAFDFPSGKVTAPYTWMSTPTIHNQIFNLSNKDSSIKSPDATIPIDAPSGAIKFGPSSLKKDAGQTTIPLLDAQPVEGKPGSPLTGIGLFYKASAGFGGFLAFRLHSLNLAEYMTQSNSSQLREQDFDIFDGGIYNYSTDPPVSATTAGGIAFEPIQSEFFTASIVSDANKLRNCVVLIGISLYINFRVL